MPLLLGCFVNVSGMGMGWEGRGDVHAALVPAFFEDVLGHGDVGEYGECASEGGECYGFVEESVRVVGTSSVDDKEAQRTRQMYHAFLGTALSVYMARFGLPVH